MQHLSIVPRLLPAVRRGEKTHTLRWQEGYIHPGPLRYCNQQNPADTLVVWVTSVETLPLCAAAERLGKQAEWPDDVLLAGMREHYPAIELNSVVQLVHHLTPEASRQKMAED